MNQLLTKIERIVRTDIRYLVRGGFWLTLGQVVSSLGGFVTSVAFAHLVSPHIYGTYKYILSLVSIISNFNLTGFSTSIIRGAAQNNDGVLAFSIKKSMAWSMLTVIAGIGVAIYYVFQENYIFGLTIGVSTLLFTFSNIWILYGPFLSGKKEFALNTKYVIINSVVTTACLLLMILVSPGVLQLACAFFVPSFILNWYFYKKTEKKFVKNTNVETTYYSESIHLSIANFIAGIAQNIDKVLLFQFLGPVDLAIYNFAIAVPDQIRGLMKGVSRLAFPKFAEKSWGEVRATIGHKTLLLALGSAAIAAVYIPLAPYFYQIFFPTYLDSVIYSQYAAIALIAIAGSLPYAAIQAHGKTRESYYFIIITSVVQIASTVPAIMLYGLMGAVIAFVFNKFFAAIFSYWLMQRVAAEDMQ